jgi:hypothetical protein
MSVRRQPRIRAGLVVAGASCLALAGALAVPAPAAAEGSATITGYVEETGRVPTTGVDVYLWSAAGTFVADTVTGTDGTFTFADLEPGGYKVEYENQAEATAEWFSNKPDLASATVITVGKGQVGRADAYLTMAAENTVRPVVSGTAAVGSTLTSTTGTWYPTPSSGYSRQWLRDGADVDGATGTSYVLTAADAGARISVRVTATNLGYTESAVSDQTVAVSGGGAATVTAVSPPTVQGTAAVGRTVTATPGGWSPSDVTVAHQWLLGGTPIAGATGSSLVLLPAHQGQQVSVRATATRGAATASSTSSAVTVAAGTFATTTPTVAGTPAVGSTLTASAGAWTPAASSSGWAWKDAATEEVVGTGATWTPDADDVGRSVVAVLTGSATGYTTASRASVPVGPVTAEPAMVLAPVAAPAATGTARVGSTLRLRPATWTLMPTTVRHTWLRNGAPIAGATGATYRLTAADAGRRISVRSVATNGGSTATSTSPTTAAVAKASTRLVATGKPAQGRATVTIRLTTLGAGGGKVVVSTRNKGRTVKRTVALRGKRATVTFAGLTKGKHAFTVTYAGDASSAAARGTWTGTIR